MKDESYWLQVYLYHGYRSFQEKLENFLHINKLTTEQGEG